ncbi:MAG: HNH endonuclease, partial [Lachnospiraceae bacterium]|nr:HNH endonuclease [Lachnospiraceae bacterium]
HLPDWEIYFPRLAELEHHAYRMIWAYEAVQHEFRKCAREHLNNPEIEHRLYRQGLEADAFKEQLQSVIYPIYLSAKTCGFSSWAYMP